jgi:lipopolysaccharide/colanic/teichoic acid biosynthesis glycosyltransferase
LLRRTHADEWPQLWNVLAGEMSLVGPRPEDPRFVDAADPAWRRVLSVRPGLTGTTQLAFAGREASLVGDGDPETGYRARVLPSKLAADAAYVDARTFGGDLAILARTARYALGGRR